MSPPVAEFAALPDTADAQQPQLPPSRSFILSNFLVANPLVTPALGLIAGIIFDNACPVPVPLTCALFAAAGGLIRFTAHRWFVAWIAILIAAAVAGAALHDLSFRRWSADHIAQYASPQGQQIKLRGTIISAPVIRSSSTGSAVWYPEVPHTRLVLNADAIVVQRPEPESVKRAARPDDGVSVKRAAGFIPALSPNDDGALAVSGLVTVVIREPVLAATAGQHVELFGTLRRIEPPVNPGAVDFSLVSRRNGILAMLSCKRSTDVQIRGKSPWHWRSGLDRLRQRARIAMLEDTYTGDVPGSGLLAGMVLGQRSEIDPKLNDAFVRSGTVHYLSVSGAHVGMLVAAVWAIGWLLGLNRRQCAGWAMAAATAYAILAEPSAPIIRAAIMTDLVCLAMLARRPVRVANCLALSAIVILVIWPTQLFDAGFQLSYVTLLSVIYVSPRAYYTGQNLYRRLARRDDPLLSPETQQKLGMRSPYWAYWDRLARALGWYAAVGLSASCVGALLSAFHFHQTQCWGWINTIILMPIIWLVMVLGLIKTGIVAIAPFLSTPLGWVLASLSDLLIRLVEFMARAPAAAFATPAVPPWLVGLGLFVVVIWTLQPALRIPLAISRALVLLFAFLLAWNLAPPAPQNALTMHVLSVGNGTAAVIQLPNGKTLVNDMGCFPPFDLEKWTLGPLLSQERVWRVDAVILSHANLDHYSGLLDLMDRRCVAQLITTPHFEHAAKAHSTSRDLVERWKRAPDRWHRVARGNQLTGTGQASIEVLWPPAEEIQAKDTNDTSLVLRITYGRSRILCCGDIEEYAMQKLIATADLRADVLLLPHHGSVTPSTAAFVRAVDPQYCIRSTGRPETSPALAEIVKDRTYLSTAQHGAIQIRLTPMSLTVRPHKP